MRLVLTLTAATFAVAMAGCSKPTASTDAGPSAAAPGPVSAEDRQKLLAALPAPYTAGDLANGEAKFALCRSCHTIEPGGPNMTGPNLHGVFGRAAASAAEFKYSDALKGAGIVWNADHLNQWLELIKKQAVAVTLPTPPERHGYIKRHRSVGTHLGQGFEIG